MNKIKKISFYILTAMLLVFALTACSQNDSANVTEEKVVNVLVSGDLKPENKDPINTESHNFYMLEMVYDPLVRYSDGGEIIPALAESWEISPDGTTYTFNLRKDVKFSDGSDFTADNVIQNAARWADKKVFSAELIEVNKIDDYTVSFVFSNAAYAILTEFTYPRPYRFAAADAFGEDGELKEMIGTGQWMLQDFETNKEASFVPNPHYYGEKPKVDKIVMKRVNEGQAKAMALQSGEIDLCLADIPSESMEVIRNDKKLKELVATSTMGFYIIMNDQNHFLQDKNVRLALNYAVDKDTICENVLSDQGVPAKGLLNEATPYVTAENSKGYSYNLEKAKELLKEAGFEDTDGDGIVEKDGEKLTLNLVFQTEEYTVWKSLCEFLQSEYAKIGVEITLEQKDVNSYYDSIWATRDFDLVLYRTYEDSWNPHGFIASMFIQSDEQQAVTWNDKQLSDNVQTVLKETDEAKRIELYNQIFTQINDEALVIPLYYPKRIYIYNAEKLTNVTAAPTSYEGVDWTTLEIK